jgi:hypothetical protein
VGSAQFNMPGLTFTVVPGTFQAVDCDTLGTITALGGYMLHQNQPNPFRISTVIPYDLPIAGHVRIFLFDDKGTVVRVLVDENQGAGHHDFQLVDPTLPSGIYTYEIISGYYRRARQMVIIE